jgi:hypothetical protein
MTIYKAYFWSFLVLLFVSVAGNAQTGEVKEKAQFKLGAYYNTHLNYYGRTDSLRSSGFFPVAELWFNKNVYINAAPVFVNNTVSNFKYAGTVLTAGYQFNHENKSAGHVYLVKPIYQDNSQLVQSALKAQFSGSFTWMNKYINLTGGGDIKLSDKLDYGATAGLDHIFRFQGDGPFVIVLDPSAVVNAGTQQFARTYYKKSSFLFFPGVEQIVTENVKKFNILSYEFSMPVIVSKGKFQVLLIPAYVIPQNLVSVPGRPDLSERGKEMFYATVGAKVNF